MTVLHQFAGNAAVALDARFGFGIPAIGSDEPTGPQLLTSDGDPNGVITAPAGTLALDFDTPTLWQNTDGATAWTDLNPSEPGLETLTRTIYVDGAQTATYTETGTFGRPFKTVQAAVDYARDNLAPAYNNPVLIVVAPPTGGVYQEDVVIYTGGLTIRGSGGGWPGGAAIRRIIITNATQASYATFVANGGLTAPAANYGDLVEDGAVYASGLTLQSIRLGDVDVFAPNALMVLGVGASNGVCDWGLEVDTVEVFGTSYFRQCESIWFYNNSWLNAPVTVLNVRQWSHETGGVPGTFTMDYDTGIDEPSGNDGLTVRNARFGTVVLNGSVGAGGLGSNCQGLDVTRLDLNGTGITRLWTSVVRGSIAIANCVTVEGDHALTLHGCHIVRNMVLDNTGAAVGCTMDAGALMGALTDVGGRLTRNLSTI